jgi:hypothetical protein
VKKPPTKSRESLRALRDAEVAKAAQSALRTGDISEDEIDQLDRLSRLVELQGTPPPTWRSRAPLAAITIATLVVVSVLFFARVSSTDIELDVEATRVSFSLPTRQTLTETLPVSRLGVGRLREAEIPRAGKQDSQVLRSDEGDVAVQAAPATMGDRRGTVTLEGLVLPPAAAVSVTHAGAPRQYRVEINAAAPDLHVALFGPTDLLVSDAGRRALDFDVPSGLTLRSGKTGLFFDLSLPEGARGALARQLAARNVSLQDVDESSDGNRTIVRRVSAIVSGTLYLEELNGQERKLRAGELLQFATSEGELRSVRLEDDRIVLNFQGTVQGMTIGHGRNQISLMPTWLEWLLARHGMSLFWGTALYLCGIATAVFKWLKGRE